MERKKFLAATLALVPLIAFPQLNKKSLRTKKTFVIRFGDSRFGEHMKYTAYVDTTFRKRKIDLRSSGRGGYILTGKFSSDGK